MRGSKWSILVVIALIIAAGFVLYSVPLRLGLDLQGGVHVVLRAEETEQAEINEGTMQRVLAVINNRVNALGVTEPVIQRQGEDRLIIELPGVHDQQRALEIIGKTAQLEFRDPDDNVVLTGADLKQAQVSRDQYGRPSVAIEFTREGQKKFAEVTTRFVGRQMPVYLDDDVITNPVINEPITGGQAEITGDFTPEEASNLALLLNAGSLPVPLEMMEIRNVGPILGQESIDQSKVAGMVGVALVLAFMFVYYRLPGGIADIALAVYVLLDLAALALLGATLTLPGIVGFILSIGMAIDANVIIFERIKNELGSGKRVRAAIDAGFQRAFRAILDANVTTLITAAVLFYFGSGPVKGFAITLGLGILISMFTALVVTRLIIRYAVNANPERFSRYFRARRLAEQ